MRGCSACQGLPGPSATGMSPRSPQGWVHGVSRQPLTGTTAGDAHCRALTMHVFVSHKKTGHKGRLFYSRSGQQQSGGSLTHCLDLRVQAALVASSLINVEFTFTGGLVQDRNSGAIGLLSRLLVTGSNGRVYLFQVGPHHGAHCCIVLTTLLRLTSTLTRLR